MVSGGRLSSLVGHYSAVAPVYAWAARHSKGVGFDICGFEVMVDLCGFILVFFGNGFGVLVQGLGVGVALGFGFGAGVQVSGFRFCLWEGPYEAR